MAGRSHYVLDPQLAAGLERFAAGGAGGPAGSGAGGPAGGGAGGPPPARGDWRALRELLTADMTRLAAVESASRPDVETVDFEVTSGDGVPLPLRWYRPRGPQPGSAVVFAHGGGMIAGDIDLYDGMVSGYVDRAGVPFLSVGYRRAPETSGTTPARDVFAAVDWLRRRGGSLGVDLDRIAVMGESAGGGLAAAAAIAARDERIELAAQILIYPMLDDRTDGDGGDGGDDDAGDGGGHAGDDDAGGRDPASVVPGAWSYDTNVTGWGALLGAARGTAEVSPLAAPARLEDFRGLARAYIEAGDLDLFRDEDLAYAGRLAGAGVPLELHVHPGAPHGYERIAPSSELARRVSDDRVRVLRSL
jgi:acetyl esterase/lipase